MAQVQEQVRVSSGPDGVASSDLVQKTYIDAIHDTLQQEMRVDDRLVILGEDVGRRGGVFRVTAGLLDEFGPDRVVDTPLAESAIIGTAIGMSLNGLRPIAEIQFLDFIHSAIDQIMSEAAKIRYRSNNHFSCPLVIRVPYGGGVHGALYATCFFAVCLLAAVALFLRIVQGEAESIGGMLILGTTAILLSPAPRTALPLASAGSDRARSPSPIRSSAQLSPTSARPVYGTAAA